MPAVYKEKPRITADLEMERKLREVWSNTFHVLKDQDRQNNLIYPTKLSAIIKGKRKFFL